MGVYILFSSFSSKMGLYCRCLDVDGDSGSHRLEGLDCDSPDCRSSSVSFFSVMPSPESKSFTSQARGMGIRKHLYSQLRSPSSDKEPHYFSLR